MNPAIWVGATATLACCGLCLWFSHLNKNRMAGVFKTLASLSFVTLAWVIGLWQSHTWLVVGLLLSLAGDVLLLQKGSGWGFRMGLVAFLLAHVAFMLQFFALAPDGLPLAISLVVVMACAALVWKQYLHPRVNSQHTAILSYLVVIASMVGVSGGLVLKTPWFLLGAALFAASDVQVVRQRFIQPHKINRLLGLPMYYAAQLTLIVACA